MIEIQLCKRIGRRF